MLGGERGVKGLATEPGGVSGKPLLAHERQRAEPSNVAIVNRTTILEAKLNGRVRAFALRQISRVDEQRAGEAWLDNHAIAGGEIEDDELGASPTAIDCCACGTACEGTRRDLAKYVGFGDADPRDPCAPDRAIQISRDRFGLRELRHGRR